MMTVKVVAVVALLYFFLALVVPPSTAYPENLLASYSGQGFSQVPGSNGDRVPAGLSEVTVTTELDEVDSDDIITSISYNLGEYNCQIYTFFVNNDTCLDRQTTFEYWGFESGVAYTNSENMTFVPPAPNMWLSRYNPHSGQWDIFASGLSNFTWMTISANLNFNDSLGWNSTYFELVNDTCITTYAICSVIWSDSSTPLVYSWQGDAKGYQYLGELGVGFLTPLPRSWEDDPDYNLAGPVYPDGYYVFPGSSFVSVDRGNGDVWELQYAEEKEEFSFTDSIELSYIDVPNGVSVFPDFHLTSTLFGVYDANVADVSSCVDQDGVNCLSTISSKDGEEWIVSTEPGVTPSYLEFGLGVTSVPSNLKLILTMRFYKNLMTWRKFPYTPRSTELHQYDQTNGWTPVPAPYSLALKGTNGVKYNTADFDPFTRVLDLTGLTFNQAQGEELKLRLVFYWQFLPIAVDRIQFDLTAGYSMPAPTVLTPVYADLHFRGVSTTSRGAAANLPGYTTQYSPVYPWGIPLDMSGDLTRYGDVLSLITSNDDEYVIMGTGDEMTLRFTAPASGPSNGNQRHVLFYNRCWYKAEGKATGRTVDPLPYSSMPKYPYNPATDSYPYASHTAFLQGNTRSYEAAVPHFSLYSNKISFTIANATAPPPTTMSGAERQVVPWLFANLVLLVVCMMAFF